MEVSTTGIFLRPLFPACLQAGRKGRLCRFEFAKIIEKENKTFCLLSLVCMMSCDKLKLYSELHISRLCPAMLANTRFFFFYYSELSEDPFEFDIVVGLGLE